ncbi:hypothetical protein SporoP37_09400 [Sporosarcina sp. P37]|uniref:hypothetical protein n=1 Tax=unclassified Sporosarcina TaxID=2647733 RepID=UPI0009C07776|nr:MULTISPECIES: hypothetical protein [unclassified Sporosarcina]ARD48354.1 hypothetical protein SporoP33_09010 [Sporosarcina sp. P33]ARK24860.1 hypothetical protein SporoP37_09400 [Sporosarcina sp. P37]PID20018.1 hypothetical protein CSV62_01935 [Sporosarcina sp. P35]
MNIQAFSGAVMVIHEFPTGRDSENGCYLMMTVDNGYGNVVNFVVEPTTYFVDHVKIKAGDRVTGFYDADAPTPFIYPPQFRALVMCKDSRRQHVKVDYFNRRLESSDGTLQINLSPQTEILLTNGQSFKGNIAQRNLVVIYDTSSRSIPAQTTPHRIIVLC